MHISALKFTKAYIISQIFAHDFLFLEFLELVQKRKKKDWVKKQKQKQNSPPGAKCILYDTSSYFHHYFSNC